MQPHTIILRSGYAGFSLDRRLGVPYNTKDNAL